MSRAVYAAGRVRDGGIVIDPSPALRLQLRELGDGPVDLTIRRFKATRSSQQNRFYWGAVLPLIAETTGYTREECHDLMKSLHLPREMAVCDGNGEEIGRYVLGGSTAKLDTEQFNDYIARIRGWALDTLGVVIPNDEMAAAA